MVRGLRRSLSFAVASAAASVASVAVRPSILSPRPPPLAAGRAARAMVGGSGGASSEGSPDDFRLGFMTDVEGNLGYFRRCVERSSVLELVRDGKGEGESDLMLDLVGRGAHFVYGGDVVDRGPGDIRLTRCLVDLKRRHPDRVHLLVGNRDLNKIRLTAELSAADLARRPEDIPAPHWDPAAPTLVDYLEGLVDEEEGGGMGRPRCDIADVDTRANRLRYMLKHTLGCPDTFEYRRTELAILRGGSAPPAQVSDDDVVRSFLREIEDPSGSLHAYLRCACVAVAVGSTLFVHGAVDRRTMGYVPDPATRFELPDRSSRSRTDDIGTLSPSEWVEGLNGFLRAGLDDYAARPGWDAARTTRGGEALVALQNRCATWGRSVISNSYGDGGCITTEHALSLASDPGQRAREAIDPLAFERVSSDPTDRTVAEWLLSGGIRRVVVGHKPTGDAPAVLSAHETGVEVVSADTNYSDPASPDGRGRAVPVVEILGQTEFDNRLELSGTLSDGTEHRSVLNRLHGFSGIDETVGDSLLGRQIREETGEEDGDGPGRWWVKASTATDYRLARGRGRRVDYKSVPKAELAIESMK